MATIINADTSNGLKLTSDTSGQLELQSAGSTKVTMDTSGNVGIGTNSPSYELQVAGGAANNNNDANVIVVDGENHSRLKVNTSTSGGYQAGLVLSSGEALSSTTNEVKISTTGSQEMRFTTANAERMRIDSSGNVFVGPTATQNGATGVVYSKTTAKAWVTFTGFTGAVLSSFNVSSVTRASAGVYTVNFTSAMPNTNYTSFYMAQPTVTNAGADTFAINPTTSTVTLNHWEANVRRDSNYSCVVIFGSA